MHVKLISICKLLKTNLQRGQINTAAHKIALKELRTIFLKFTTVLIVQPQPNLAC